MSADHNGGNNCSLINQIHKVITSSHPSVDPEATLEMILGLRFIIPSIPDLPDLFSK